MPTTAIKERRGRAGMTTIIGLDPGTTGGIAALVQGELHLLKLESLTDREVADALANFHVDHPVSYLEDPRGIMPGRRTPKSIAGPAESFGFLRGVLVALCYRLEIVKPREWQASFKLPSLKAAGSSTAKKRSHREAAQRLHPSINVTNATADALLILEYGRRDK